jgi:hypothetical protein
MNGITANGRIGTGRAGLLVAALALMACGRAGNDAQPAMQSAASASVHVPKVAWRFEAPTAWGTRVVISELDSAERVSAGPGIVSVREFNYMPQDTTIHSQTLLMVLAYDSATWARIAAEPGPPQGDEILRQAGLVYIASLPQSNPFAPGTPDFRAFDTLSVSLAYVKGALRPVP